MLGGSKNRLFLYVCLGISMCCVSHVICNRLSYPLRFARHPCYAVCIPILTPFHSAFSPSSIHLHSIGPTLLLTYSINALAPGAPLRIPIAPTRGMHSTDANRGSEAVGSVTSRVVVSGVGEGPPGVTLWLMGTLLLSLRVLEEWRYTRVGRCACGSEDVR